MRCLAGLLLNELKDVGFPVFGRPGGGDGCVEEHGEGAVGCGVGAHPLDGDDGEAEAVGFEIRGGH